MTFEEAIKHCEEVAYQNEFLMKRYDDASGYNRSHDENIRTDGAKGCEQLISLYRQIAEWLRELKCYRDFKDKGYVMCRFEVAQDDRRRITKMVLDFSTKELFDNIEEVNADAEIHS